MSEKIYKDRDGNEFYNSQKKKLYDRFDEFVDIVFVKNRQIDWAKSVTEKKLVALEKEEFRKLLDKDVYKDIIKEEATASKPCILKPEIPNKDRIRDKSQNNWEKAIKENKPLETLLDHLTYIWSLGSAKKTSLYVSNVSQKSEDIFCSEGLWKSGMADSFKPSDFGTLIYLIDNVKNDSGQNVFETLEKLLRNITNFNPPIKNAFLHFCNPDKYAPVAATATKKSIKKNLSFVLDENQTPSDLDECILAIHKKIKEIQPEKYKDVNGCIFWPDYGTIISEKGDGASDYATLKFKKAVVLYGPPGTSKTYSAKTMAELIILGHKKKIEEGNYIHRLQLHPNYSYEDFVWGYEISTKGQSSISKPKKGYILDLLEKIKEEKEPKVPHVLILDEINRVDLSRLFGELFSAIENRNEEIELPVSFDGTTEKYKICIPDNLYIIGTMNEIDFSLERVDFALRRRFAWIFKGYDEELLKEIIKKKLEEAKIDDINVNDYQDYINECTQLNDKISEDLGKQYQIGHTIFAEIIGVQKDMCLEDFPLNTIKQAKKILWNISVKPLLEAYLGNIEQKEIEKNISEYEDVYGLNNKGKGKDSEEYEGEDGNGEDS